MPTYPILPSLSRAPSYSSTREIEDGTISDPMESGYVATRPRFTRLRRKFGVTYKYLNAEDVRALDRFETQTVFGKAGAFYMPNLLPNGSFEQVGITGSGVDGWDITSGPFAVTVGSVASDGSAALVFTLQSTRIEAFTTKDSFAEVEESLTLAVGDVLAFACQASTINTVPGPAGTSGTEPYAYLSAQLVLVYSDGSSQTLSQTAAQYATTGFQPVSLAFTIPAPVSGVAGPVSGTFQLRAELSDADFFLGNNVSQGAAVFTVDEVALAVMATQQPYGRMPGSAPIASAVRLTKNLALKDAGYANGAPAYECSFEVTEV